MRLIIAFFLLISGFRLQVSQVKAQTMPEFWFSTTSDTIMMIEPRGETPGKANLFVYIMGTRMDDTTGRVKWFRAFMDSTHNKKLTGYELLKRDSITKHNLTIKGELLADAKGKADVEFKVHTTRETKKSQDTTMRIFQIMYRIQVTSDKEQVLRTRDHYYEYVGNSTEEAYEKILYTLYAWKVPGKHMLFWMLGTMDSYIDPARQYQVFSIPVNYYGYGN